MSDLVWNSKTEMLKALKARDARIEKLEAEIKRLKAAIRAEDDEFVDLRVVLEDNDE